MESATVNGFRHWLHGSNMLQCVSSTSLNLIFLNFHRMKSPQWMIIFGGLTIRDLHYTRTEKYEGPPPPPVWTLAATIILTFATSTVCQVFFLRRFFMVFVKGTPSFQFMF